MRFHLFTFAIAALCALRTKTEASAAHEESLLYDVAIVGGGSGGIHAAIRLKDAGAKVIVIEKSSQIGGHAETYFDPETKQLTNMGVRILIDTAAVIDYFSRLQVPISRIDLSGESESDAIASYSRNVLLKYGWVDQGYFLPNPVPEELTWTFEKFAYKCNCSALLLVIAGIGWYNGNITKIPALYVVKDFGPSLLKSFTEKFIIAASGDTRSLYSAAATELGKDTLLNSIIINVNRRYLWSAKNEIEDTGVVNLVVKQPYQLVKVIRARKLLISISPTLESVGSFDLSDNKYNLFSKFSGLGYFSGIARIPGLETTLQNVGAFTRYHIPLIPGSNIYYSAPNSPYGFTFNVAFDYYKCLTNADAEAIVRKELATLARAGAFPIDEVENITIPFISNHSSYNVRVSAQDIGNGFYQRLLEIQGVRNTYWTGAAFAGQNSGLIWAWNDGTVIPALRADLGL